MIHEITPIAHIHTEFSSKFGIPRQSGLVEELKGTIIFEPEYRDPQALRGLDGFSHIWLIWLFSESVCREWSPTVRPPRLGGNTRMGVFATRSPFRPNSLGLSSMRIEHVEENHPKYGPVIQVAGADLMDGTPIFDIKPYVPQADSHPQALGGFSANVGDYHLQVEIPESWLWQIPEEKQEALKKVLAEDPRPAYQKEAGRVYGFSFAGQEIRFQVNGNVLTVCGVEKAR